MNNKTKKTINYIFAAFGFMCFAALCIQVDVINLNTIQCVFLSIPFISTFLHLYVATTLK